MNRDDKCIIIYTEDAEAAEKLLAYAKNLWVENSRYWNFSFLLQEMIRGSNFFWAVKRNIY